MEAVKRDCLQSRVLHDPDIQDARPLDLAMHYEQWSALSLLVGAGALQSWPPFIAARNQLELVIPATQLPGMGHYGSFAPLVSPLSLYHTFMLLALDSLLKRFWSQATADI